MFELFAVLGFVLSFTSIFFLYKIAGGKKLPEVLNALEAAKERENSLLDEVAKLKDACAMYSNAYKNFTDAVDRMQDEYKMMTREFEHLQVVAESGNTSPEELKKTLDRWWDSKNAHSSDDFFDHLMQANGLGNSLSGIYSSPSTSAYCSPIQAQQMYNHVMKTLGLSPDGHP